MSQDHRLQTPWEVVEHEEGFEVRNSAGLSLAYVYYENEPTVRRVMNRLTRDGAYSVAANIAELPVLLGARVDSSSLRTVR